MIHRQGGVYRASVFAFLFFLLGYSTTSPLYAAVCNKAFGEVQEVTYDSDVLNAEMRYFVYLPPCYNDESVYPALYLMHGSNANYTHWLQLGLNAQLDRAISNGDLPPMIVVLPDGGWIANRNWFVGEQSWSNIVLTELIPDAESQFQIDARREMRAIGGISRGGFWAFNIAFRFPDLFYAVGGHSAFFDKGHRPEAYNPLYLAASAQNLDQLHIWLDRGVNDYAWFNLDIMHDTLYENGINHAYTVYQQGEHDNSYWSAHIMDYLRFYATGWMDLRYERPVSNIDVSTGIDLFLPVVAHPNPQATIQIGRVDAVAQGYCDFALIMAQSTVDKLAEQGVELCPTTVIVDSVLDALLLDPDLYTIRAFDELSPEYKLLYWEDVHPLDSNLNTYPLAFQSKGSATYDSSRLTRIAMSGVTALARGTREAIDKQGIPWAAGGILPYVSQADYFHISNEASFHELCPNSDEPLQFGGLCAKDEHFDLLTYLGVDIVELSGNHNNDYGFKAYLRSLAFYHDAGMLTVGGGADVAAAREPLLLNHNGNQIALLACNWNGPEFAWVSATQPGATPCDWAWLTEVIPQLANRYDVVIVSSQYLEYDRYLPADRHQRDFRQLADLGTDIVIGTQAHNPQTFELYMNTAEINTFIHYGLGNLYFDQTEWAQKRFFIDQFFVYEGQLIAVDMFMGVIDDLARPRPMTPTEQSELWGVLRGN